MRIGYDAKRAFKNFSGLGNYSRTLITQMKIHFPENEYFLYTSRIPGPGLKDLTENAPPRYPQSTLGKSIPSLWRSYGISQDIQQDKIDVYHGLSNELPLGIGKTGAKSVVTVHDLIFLRFPELYKPVDRFLYRKKLEYCVENADHIIATSEQTRNDLLDFVAADQYKISVVYQPCNPIFKNRPEEGDKEKIRQTYNLPSSYLLYVGTIEKRKNLLSIIRALHEENIQIPLVVVGKETAYAKKVHQYIEEKGVKNILFLKNVPNQHLPVLYHMAKIFIYPSEFEGFGIPVLEAVTSGVPVIAGKGSCLEETGGVGSRYIDPEDIESIGDTIRELLDNPDVRENMIEKGLQHAEHFNGKTIAQQLNYIYDSLL